MILEIKSQEKFQNKNYKTNRTRNHITSKMKKVRKNEFFPDTILHKIKLYCFNIE